MILKPTEPLPVEKKPSKIIGGMPDGIGVGKKVLERNTYKGIRSNQGIQGGPLQKDPAIIAMESAGLQTTGRELVPIKEYAKKDPKELEERPSEVAKKTFEAHGLNFVYVATKIHEIMDGGEPKTQLQALDMVNKILLKTEEEADEMKKLIEAARTPSVVINITSPYSPDAKSNLDILIPS